MGKLARSIEDGVALAVSGPDSKQQRKANKDFETTKVIRSLSVKLANQMIKDHKKSWIVERTWYQPNSNELKAAEARYDRQLQVLEKNLKKCTKEYKPKKGLLSF